MVGFDLRTFYLNDLTFHGCTITGLEVFPNLVGYIERGEIKPLLAKTYPLAQLREAQQAFIDKQHVGNIVGDHGQLIMKITRNHPLARAARQSRRLLHRRRQKLREPSKPSWCGSTPTRASPASVRSVRFPITSPLTRTAWRQR